MNREQLAARAVELAGGASGYTEHYDPRGLFRLVTEGLQTANHRAISAWAKLDPATRGKRPVHFSACQFLASRLALEACELKPGMTWCNRVDGGNTRIPGIELIRIKNRASYAWKDYGPKTAWDIGIGDAVEVMGKYGPHTFVVTALRFDAGVPVSLDRAEYGQFLDPDGPEGPEPADDGAHVRTGSVITRDAKGWKINGAPVIGRLNIMALRQRELGDVDSERDTDPAPEPPPDSQLTPVEVPHPPIKLERGSPHTELVRTLQRRLAKEPRPFKLWLRGSANTAPPPWPAAWNWPIKPDGDFGERTEAALADYQHRNPPLVVDGWVRVGGATWQRLGLP